jgi:hypothetical protein
MSESENDNASGFSAGVVVETEKFHKKGAG